MRRPCIYILRCADRSYYVGATTHLTQRLHQHEAGVVPGFTQNRLPFEVVLVLEFPTIPEAAQAERKVKRWSRAKKEALIRDDFGALKNLAACKNSTHYLIQKSFGRVKRTQK